ncbi:MAG TPA: hypothetical protein VM509_03230, partial [Planctomycetota bacterium]|nr:hypothetical protein [Planctomycetota bacterium]
RWLGILALASVCLLGGGCSGPREVRSAVEGGETARGATDLEGTAHGFPELRTLQGTKLGDGEFKQWLEGGALHVLLRYELDSGGWIEESSVLRQEPLVQEQWSWAEFRSGTLHRRLQIDFLSGDAVAEKRGSDGVERWSKHLDVEPGKAFAGFAWSLAIRSRREALQRGEKVELQGIGFTPKPTSATVQISFLGVEQLTMAERSIAGEHYVIHPKVPWIAKPFVEAPDSSIWLTLPPVSFLRFEGPLAEPDDAIVRVDLLPGGASRKAEPANR